MLVRVSELATTALAMGGSALSFPKIDVVNVAHEIVRRYPNDDDIMRHMERWELLGVPHVSTWNEPLLYTDIREAEREVMVRWREVQDLILELHQVHFESVVGVGHRRLPVAEVVKSVSDRRGGKIKAAIKRAIFETNHTRVNEMTEQERQERTKALEYFNSLGRMTDGRRKRHQV